MECHRIDGKQLALRTSAEIAIIPVTCRPDVGVLGYPGHGGLALANPLARLVRRQHAEKDANFSVVIPCDDIKHAIAVPIDHPELVS